MPISTGSKCPTCGEPVPFWVYGWETFGFEHNCPKCGAPFRVSQSYLWKTRGIILLIIAPIFIIGAITDHFTVAFVVAILVCIGYLFHFWFRAELESGWS
jgi:hypothetical protein